jgi:hypothetical protein
MLFKEQETPKEWVVLEHVSHPRKNSSLKDFK